MIGDGLLIGRHRARVRSREGCRAMRAMVNGRPTLNPLQLAIVPAPGRSGVADLAALHDEARAVPAGPPPATPPAPPPAPSPA